MTQLRECSVVLDKLNSSKISSLNTVNIDSIPSTSTQNPESSVFYVADSDEDFVLDM